MIARASRDDLLATAHQQRLQLQRHRRHRQNYRNRGRDGRARSARGLVGGLSVPKPPKGVVVAAVELF